MKQIQFRSRTFWNRVEEAKKRRLGRSLGILPFDYVKQWEYAKECLPYVAHIRGKVVSISPEGKRKELSHS